jgi:hypothetical protein
MWPERFVALSASDRFLMEVSSTKRQERRGKLENDCDENNVRSSLVLLLLLLRYD